MVSEFRILKATSQILSILLLMQHTSKLGEVSRTAAELPLQPQAQVLERIKTGQKFDKLWRIENISI